MLYNTFILKPIDGTPLSPAALIEFVNNLNQQEEGVGMQSQEEDDDDADNYSIITVSSGETEQDVCMLSSEDEDSMVISRFILSYNCFLFAF